MAPSRERSRSRSRSPMRARTRARSRSRNEPRVRPWALREQDASHSRRARSHSHESAPSRHDLQQQINDLNEDLMNAERYWMGRLNEHVNSGPDLQQQINDVREELRVRLNTTTCWLAQICRRVAALERAVYHGLAGPAPQTPPQ